MYRHSVAMSATTHADLARHLLRPDGQEDICLATYSLSTGARRTTRVLGGVELPHAGEREVHGNATITGNYVLRVAALAAGSGLGVALLHSHPASRGWQGLSKPDFEAETSYADLVMRMTGHPLIGMTLAGDERWSARVWINGAPDWAGSVRTVGTDMRVTWNDDLVAPNVHRAAQARTISAWGELRHRDITRLRVLVVGVGSVGLDVAQRLAATGIAEIGVMDYDRVELLNLDRMIGATRRDARLGRRKIDVAARLARRAATAANFAVYRHADSICTPTGLDVALDYDVIFSCVDRPWARAVLNTIAYADLIPVIDGGIAIDTLDSGEMRNATRRAQSATPGRPCLACANQINMSEVALEMSGDLDDPEYVRRAGRQPVSGRPNVAALCAAVSGSQLEQFVSLVARPGGQGVPSPLRFNLSTHHLEHLRQVTQPHCVTEQALGAGDERINLTREIGPWNTSPRVPRRPLRRRVNQVIDRWIERTENS